MSTRSGHLLSLCHVVVLTSLMVSASPSRAVGSEATASGRYPLVSASLVVSADEADLEDGAIVVGVLAGGEARAYPIRSLWEEGMHTVNDRLGDDPIAVSMCPLAGVGIAYDRRAGEAVLDLGTLVEVDRGALSLYDDASETRWGLLSGRAFEGPRGGGDSS